MLVLTRKEGESLLIGGDVKITIYKIGGNSVRVAIDAPQDVLILRSELTEEKRDGGRYSDGSGY